ncbi:WavE lipopolysaccharide synthesis family protein [Planktomarina temperata]|nr:WavE lipopolysaccharide synthesis family protein [Planktomarina temperata]
MTNVLRLMVVLYYQPILFLSRIKSGKYRLALIGALLKNLNGRLGYHQVTLIPTEIPDTQKFHDAQSHKNTAIVIQGPIDKNPYIIETVKYYRRVFQSATLIVSTWEHSSQSTAQQLQKLGAIVVFSVLPNLPGRLNINYQTVSTLAGVNAAREYGCKYVLKVRSDQRITKFSALGHLKALLKIGGNPSKRVVLLGDAYNSYWSLPFHISDFLCFGEVNQVESYFNVPLCADSYAYQIDILKNFSSEISEITVSEFSSAALSKSSKRIDNFVDNLMSPEQRYFLNYIKDRYNFNLSYRENYHQQLIDHISVIDSSQLGLLWFKSSFMYSLPSLMEAKNNTGKLNQGRWLSLMSNND